MLPLTLAIVVRKRTAFFLRAPERFGILGAEVLSLFIVDTAGTSAPAGRRAASWPWEEWTPRWRCASSGAMWPGRRHGSRESGHRDG